MTESDRIKHILKAGHENGLDDWALGEAHPAETDHTFMCIHNPTGTVRWFFPTSNRYPLHLSLYNSATWKAKAYKLGTHVAFRFRQHRRMAHSFFSIPREIEIPLEKRIAPLNPDGYAVFTGTVGENRKSIIAVGQGREVPWFVKMSHSPRATQLLKGEAHTLKQLQASSFKCLALPKFQFLGGDEMLALENVRTHDARESSRLEPLHLAALTELYQHDVQLMPWGENPAYGRIKNRLKSLQEHVPVDPELSPSRTRRITELLKSLFAQMPAEAPVRVAFAHRDFTPWNMYVSRNQLHVYDWELAADKMPLLYDLFHFVYQGGVLLLRQGYSRIRRERFRALRLPETRTLVKAFELDIERYHAYYLLDLISYYLDIYIREPQLHMQAFWLLQTWEAALTDALQVWNPSPSKARPVPSSY